MMFWCNGCQAERDFFKEFKLMVVSEDHKRVDRYCRDCRSGTVYNPDVFWDGKPEENLADDPVTGKPRVFSCPSEKAAYLRSKGLQEAGDRVHGAPVMLHQTQPPKADSRHEVKMALKQVRELGVDRRRQEYLRIVKENRGRMP